MYFASSIYYLVSPEVETLPKLIPAGTKRQNNKQQPQPATTSCFKNGNKSEIRSS